MQYPHHIYFFSILLCLKTNTNLIIYNSYSLIKEEPNNSKKKKKSWPSYKTKSLLIILFLNIDRFGNLRSKKSNYNINKSETFELKTTFAINLCTIINLFFNENNSCKL
jgi:hypothetical protein